MKKTQLLDLIQQVSRFIESQAPIIVGSHSLFAITDQVPSIVSQSVEADFLLAEWGIEVMREVGNKLGIRSDFFDANGYYADPLGFATVVLVPGWRERLNPLTDANGRIVAHCLEPHASAASKLIAGRPKDFQFIISLLESGYIEFPTFIERAALIQQTASEGALLPRLHALHGQLGHVPLTLDLTLLRNLIQQLAVPSA